MPKRPVDEAQLFQAMERAWLIMAFISVALSDHPIVRSSKVYRRCADRARKALFDLHCKLEATSEALRISNGVATPTDDDFAAEFLRLKGSVPKSVVLDFDSDEAPATGRRRSRRHK